MRKEGAEGQALRVRVVTGGCSGYEYALEFVASPEQDDRCLETDGLRVYIAADSTDKLAGTVLDYVGGLYGAGLKFLNPKAVHSCGCGTSFSLE